jgi:hypothetical protein
VPTVVSTEYVEDPTIYASPVAYRAEPVARWAESDALIICANLMASRDASVQRAVMVLHATPYQADDLLDVSELDGSYTDVDGHAVYNARLLGWAPVRIIVDRTVEPTPEITAAFAEPWPFEVQAGERDRILHGAGTRS